MDDAMVQDFRNGVDAYWSGQLADGWDNESVRNRSPYIMGWYLASMWEVSPGYVLDEDGNAFQTPDCADPGPDCIEHDGACD
jgi:hypothetical protein